MMLSMTRDLPGQVADGDPACSSAKEASSPFAGMTRIRFKGSPRCPPLMNGNRPSVSQPLVGTPLGRSRLYTRQPARQPATASVGLRYACINRERIQAVSRHPMLAALAAAVALGASPGLMAQGYPPENYSPLLF